MAEFKINDVTFASESGGVVSLSDANIFPKGHIVQTKTAVKTTAVVAGNMTAGSWVDTGLSVDIKPNFNNSKIYFLHGGIKSWIDCGYPLISTNEEDAV